MLKLAFLITFQACLASNLPAQDIPNVFGAKCVNRATIPNVFSCFKKPAVVVAKKPNSPTDTQSLIPMIAWGMHPQLTNFNQQVSPGFFENRYSPSPHVTNSQNLVNNYEFRRCSSCIQPAGQVIARQRIARPYRNFRK